MSSSKILLDGPHIDSSIAFSLCFQCLSNSLFIASSMSSSFLNVQKFFLYVSRWKNEYHYLSMVITTSKWVTQVGLSSFLICNKEFCWPAEYEGERRAPVPGGKYKLRAATQLSPFPHLLGKQAWNGAAEEAGRPAQPRPHLHPGQHRAGQY